MDRHIVRLAKGASALSRVTGQPTAVFLSLILAPVLAACAGTELPKTDTAGVAPASGLTLPAPAPAPTSGGVSGAVAAAPSAAPSLASPAPLAKPAATAAPVAAAASPALTAPGTAADAAASGQETIVGFKGRSVLLYNSPESNDGQRMPVGAFALPMVVSRGQGRGARLEVQTSEGPRWVASSEVVLAGKAAPN